MAAMREFLCDFKFKENPICEKNLKEIDLEKLFIEFPELQNGGVGVHDITALQVLCAFTKNGTSETVKKELLCGDVNKGDHLGRHPLHYAVMNGNYELASLLLEHGANPDCKFLLEKTTLRDLRELNINWNRLYGQLPSPDGWRRTPLHIAVKQDLINLVELLIEKGANINAEDDKGLTPLLLAGHNHQKEPFEEIVKILVENGARTDMQDRTTGTTALFHAAVVLKSVKATKILLNSGAWLTVGSCKQTELHVLSSYGLEEILILFLEDQRMTSQEINRMDDFGRTPLFRAAYGSHKNCFKTLVKHGGGLDAVAKSKESVMDGVFAHIPKPSTFVRQLFDENVQGNASQPTELILDFNILAPEGCTTQMDVISNVMVASTDKEKFEVLLHPLIESFLRLKWEKIKPFFFLLIFLYITFALSLSSYVILLLHHRAHLNTTTHFFRFLTIFSSGALSGHAIIQLGLVRRKVFNQYELWMNVACTILSLILAIAGDDHISEEVKVDTPKWILHAASVAVLFAWAEMMMLIGRLPAYGYYALMFAAVLQNVIKVLFIFVCLVLGFAISFSIQFHSSEEFANPWRAMVKTTVMMMGEFEYTSLFSSSEGKTHRLPTTSRIIFLFFIILASIVLMNLMVGLAVSDIQGLQEESHGRRLEKQAEFLRQFEKVQAFRWIVDSFWFPQWLKNFIRRRRCIKLKLAIPVEHFALISNKKIKKLPTELIESLVNIATRKKSNKRECEKEEVSKNPSVFVAILIPKTVHKKSFKKPNLNLKNDYTKPDCIFMYKST